MKQVLGRSVDQRVMERLLEASDMNLLAPERNIVTVLFADIRGSTRLAETTEPAELLGRFINHFLAEMSTIIVQNQGTLDKVLRSIF